MNENPRSSPNTTTMAAVRRVLSRQWCGRRARTRVPESRVAVTGREKFPLCAAIPPPPSARPEQGIDIDPVHADAPVQVRTRRQAGATHPAQDGPFGRLLAWGAGDGRPLLTNGKNPHPRDHDPRLPDPGRRPGPAHTTA